MNFNKTHIVRCDQPAPGYVLLTFRGDHAIGGTPGQFVMVRGDWGDDPVLPRAFSLVQSGSEGQILVRVIGRGTRRLAELRPGDPLWVLGPRGHGYAFAGVHKRAVLVAGGVGVAPLLFLAKSLRDTDAPRPRCVFGARTGADLVLREALQLDAETTLVTEDGSLGEKGRVTDLLSEILVGEPQQVFACGPNPMLAAVAEISRLHATGCQVAFESPMACGMGSCKGCAIPGASGDYLYVCSDGPVFDTGDIYGGGQCLTTLR